MDASDPPPDGSRTRVRIIFSPTQIKDELYSLQHALFYFIQIYNYIEYLFNTTFHPSYNYLFLTIKLIIMIKLTSKKIINTARFIIATSGFFFSTNCNLGGIALNLAVFILSFVLLFKVCDWLK